MYDLTSNILSASGLSASQLESAASRIRPDNKFGDAFPAFVAAEKKYGINAVFIMAHAAIESAWGTSYFATSRNNLFGFNATDSNPNDATTYPSVAAAVDSYASFLKKNYLTTGGVYFNGFTPHAIFVRYSSSHDVEAQNVCNLMNQIVANDGGATFVPDATHPTAAAAGDNEYDVVSGDTLGAIAAANQTTVGQIIEANSGRYPSIGTGTDAHLETGWRIFVPTQATPMATVEQPVQVYVPSGKQGFLGTLAANYGTTVQQLIDWNKAKYPEIGQKVGKIPDYIQAGWLIRVR